MSVWRGFETETSTKNSDNFLFTLDVGGLVTHKAEITVYFFSLIFNLKNVKNILFSILYFTRNYKHNCELQILHINFIFEYFKYNYALLLSCEALVIFEHWFM